MKSSVLGLVVPVALSACVPEPVPGSLGQERVAAWLSRPASMITECATAELRRSPKLPPGDYWSVADFVVEPDGTITNVVVRLKPDSPLATHLRDCITSHVERWRTPRATQPTSVHEMPLPTIVID